MLPRHLAITTAAMLLTGVTQAQIVTDQFATGNMHFDPKAMDSNGDGRVTKEEMRRYGESMWRTMSKGKPTIPVQEAAEDFSRGNMRLDATRMDTNHDGQISESELLAYAGHRYDQMKGRDGTMSFVAMAEAFSRGNQRVAESSAQPANK